VDVISNFFLDLFSSDGFPARWVCGKWTPFHGWLYILSGLAIWLAYFAIPVLMVLFIRKRKEAIPFGRVFWLFIFFIFGCGLTHLSDSIMFWYPAYRVNAMLLFFTAIISWVAVIGLFRVLPQLISLKTPAQVETIMQQRFEGLLEKLRKSEERWQFALEGSQLGVWDWNTATNEVFLSKRWKEILGYEDHEVEHQFNEWFDRIHPQDQAGVLAVVNDHIAGHTPPYKVEYRIRTKAGTYIWAQTTGKVTSRCAAGNVLRLVGTLEDIHATKVFQEKLRLSENTFSSAFRFSGIGVGFTSLSGGWLDVNPALCRLLGYSREEMLQKTFQQITHPDDLATSVEKIPKLLGKEIDTFQMEKRYLHKDGQVIWVMLTVSLVWEAEDKPGFFISQIVDITHTKYLFNALEQNNEALQLTALDLEGKIRQLEEFNKIVAHNLRGPAGNMHMLLGMLPAEMPEISNSNYYKMLSQGCDNMKQTLDELMKVVELRLNREIKFDDCDLGEILNNALISFKVQLLEKNAVVEQRLEEVAVSYPKVYLESIVYNLVSNALKYSRPEVHPHIQVSTYAEKGRVVLSVKDNGLGIDLEKHGHHMFKLKKVFHKGFDSKGVGLFMTKNQIETFGGSIHVRSIPMEGSEFIVKF
jgi:PAS domain S-box-containing protein